MSQTTLKQSWHIKWHETLPLFHEQCVSAKTYLVSKDEKERETNKEILGK